MPGYETWMCTELLTQCPDCDETIEEPHGDLSKFLDMLDAHEEICDGEAPPTRQACA